MGKKQDQEKKQECAHQADQAESKKKKKMKACVACLWSGMVSMIGVSFIVYWEYKYKHTSSQLWMVPLGLILLITPLIVCFAIAASEFCCNSSKQDHDAS